MLCDFGGMINTTMQYRFSAAKHSYPDRLANRHTSLLAVLRCEVNGLNTNDALFSTMVANIFMCFVFAGSRTFQG